MRRQALKLLALSWMLLSTCGCPSLWKWNYQEAYDEDPAYLSVPDPDPLGVTDDQPLADD